jgi:hypothetical protein
VWGAVVSSREPLEKLPEGEMKLNADTIKLPPVRCGASVR